MSPQKKTIAILLFIVLTLVTVFYGIKFMSQASDFDKQIDNSILVVSQPGTVEIGNHYGKIIVQVGGVELHNGSADEIIVEATVGDGEITLNNVSTQNLTLQGGGVNSIYISGGSTVQTVHVERVDGNIRVVVTDTSNVSTMTVYDGSQDVILEGQVGVVVIEASNISVEVKGSTMDSISISGDNTVVTVDETSIFDSATLSSESNLSKYIIKGSVGTINIDSSNSSLEVYGSVTDINVSDSSVNTSILVDRDASVSSITSNADVTLLGDGTIDEVYTDSEASVNGTTTVTRYILQVKPATPAVVIYTVSFEENGGSEISDLSSVAGEKITKPTDPILPGFTFGGWYKESSFTNLWVFATDTIHANTVLTAKWTINSYTISFNTNNGSAISAITQNYAMAVTAPSNPTHPSYIFGGWYSDVGLTTAYTFTMMPASDTTLYAKWDPINVNAISINGVAKVGSTLTATFLNQTPTVSYQWQYSTDGITFTAISGATESTYTIPLGSVTKFYKVIATGIDNYSGIVTSGATSAVIKAIPNVTTEPQVLDFTYGQTLTNTMLTDALISVEGTFSFSEEHGILDAGTYNLAWIFQPIDETNYDILSGTVSVKVNKRDLTVTAAAKNKTYGDTDPALTYTITNGTLVGSDAFDGALTRNAGENVGEYEITKGTVNLGSNYDLIYVGANLTINQRALTITADAKSKTYGDTDPALTYTITSGTLVGSDAFTGTLSRATGEAAANYAITLGTVGLSTNYSLTYVGENLSINQRALTITAVAKSKTYGDTDPLLTASYLGFASGESTTNLGGSLSLSRTAGETVGDYAISPSGFTSNNYNIIFQTGTFTVTPRPITITAVSSTKLVNQVDPSFSYTLSETLRNGDIFTGNLTRDAGITVGSYTIRIGTLSAGTNYSITYVSGTLTLSKGNQTLTLSAASASGGAGSTIALSTSAPGAGAITYSIESQTSTGASVSSSGLVTLGTVGTVTVKVSKAECTNYYAANNTITITSNAVVPTLTAFTATKAGSLDINNRDLVTFTPTVYNPSGSSYPVTFTYSIIKTGVHGSIDYAGSGANTARLAVGTYTITCTAVNSIGVSNSMTYNIEVLQTSTSVGSALSGIQTNPVTLVYNGNGTSLTSYTYQVVTASGHNGGGGDTWSIIGYTGVNLTGSSINLGSGTASTGVSTSGSISEASSIKSIVFTYTVASGHSGSCLSSNVSYSVSTLIPYNDAP